MATRLPNLQSAAGLSSPIVRTIDLSSGLSVELCPADSRRWSLSVYPMRFGSCTIQFQADDTGTLGIPVSDTTPLIWVYNDLLTLVGQQLFVRSAEPSVTITVIEAVILKTANDPESEGI